MSAVERVASFLVLAGEEREAARVLLAAGQLRQAAYQCQQCAEKVARALLEHAGVAFGTSHNLGQMAEALPEGHPWKTRIAALDVLSPAATRYRYPSPAGRLAPPPSAAQIADHLTELTALVDEARRYCRPGAAAS